jgi:hypothetical protein
MKAMYYYNGKEQSVREIAEQEGITYSALSRRLKKVDYDIEKALKTKGKNQIIDLTGKRFGKWTVESIGSQDVKTKQRMWNCVCECGNKAEIIGRNLRNGISKGCRECCAKEQVKHGMTDTPIYKIWSAMTQRCTNSNNKHYSSYGGIGITVCDEWLEFENFYRDMGDSNGLTLDRQDNNGNYCKDNCRWVDRKTQANNTRSTTMIEYNGKVKPLQVWAEELGVNPNTLAQRKQRGWSDVDTIEKPISTTQSAKGGS